ncbi:tripartite tricarboxylate transporter permease [Microbacterium marinilacus]|uniref:Tripartite tricarboxylate transporter permease n=1 Tax=Microbacterium marinilacus TaxID=415209 RepID=A0ABP7BR48_9MICO|nr:tripartite tricarboxylate transporter permease [Microbacterium marinilacus]MBY0689795.1 tripartite tricarboxylate transporter permease [Microbacterium marinilacus]
MDLDTILQGFATILTPEHLLVAFLGCFAGTFFGVLPGLGPVTAIAVLFPLTTYLDPVSGILMLAAVYYGGMYGGSTTAILLNIPGEVSSLPSALEGYPLTKRGRAGAALATAAVSSFFAGIVGTIGVMLIGPSLAHFALAFGPPEQFGLILFSLTAISGLVSGSMVKGLAMAVLGMLLSLVGYDAISGAQVLTFGSWTLAQGFSVVPVMIGLFGIGEILKTLLQRDPDTSVAKVGSLMPTREERRASVGPTVRGTFQGFFLGLIPGMLPSVTSFLNYSWERRRGERRGDSRFGRGAIEGIAGPEAANNGAAMGGFVPLFSLGIPTGPSMALILAALLVYGLVPGPTLFTERSDFTAGIIASFLVANVILLVLNLPLVGLWAKIARVPFSIMGPIVIVCCLVGALLERNSTFDVGVCAAFGFIALLLDRARLPLAPLVMGFILGPSLQQTMRQSFTMSPTFFAERPIFVFFAVLSLATVGWSVFRAVRTRRESAPRSSRPRAARERAGRAGSDR